MCLCEGLGNSALDNLDINTSPGGIGVVVCPGPNIAYFDKICSLKEMVNHIYGRINIIHHPGRPHMFLKELGLYIDYLKGMVSQRTGANNQIQTINNMVANLWSGIKYYDAVLPLIPLKYFREELLKIMNEINPEMHSLELQTTLA